MILSPGTTSGKSSRAHNLARDDVMAAQAGDNARRTGTFHCQRCNETVRVQEGERIPECLNCGGKTYDERTDEPGNKS